MPKRISELGTLLYKNGASDQLKNVLLFSRLVGGPEDLEDDGLSKNQPRTTLPAII